MTKSKPHKIKPLPDKEHLLKCILNYFTYWRHIGLTSWKHWKLSVYWLFLIIIVVLLPLYAISHPRMMDGYFVASSDYYPVLVIISLSYLITGSGTSIYFVDVIKQTYESNKKTGVFWLYLISIIICCISIFCCFLGIIEMMNTQKITDIVLNTEQTSLYIFILLMSVDLLMLIAKQKEMNFYFKNNEDGEFYRVKDERDFISNQMMMIDIPVILGVLFISHYVEVAEKTGFYNTQIKIDSFQFFKSYFMIGGIGMHIIFSQFIFMVLNSKAIYAEIKNEIYKNT